MTPKQMSLSMQQDAGFEQHRKPIRRGVFLAEVDQAAPRAKLCAVIAPLYPKAPELGAGDRRPVGLERMLCIHLLQQPRPDEERRQDTQWRDAFDKRRARGGASG